MFLPRVTQQFFVCPKPFALDTYRGCPHACVYCFARGNNQFNRNHGLTGRLMRETDVEIFRAIRFEKWMRRTVGSAFDPKNPPAVFINRRVPLQIGGHSDPCPPQERRYHATESALRILADYDYPTMVQTKNPAVLFEILRRIGPGKNIAVSVSLIGLDARWLRRIEPNAPAPFDRLLFAARIATELKYPVNIKMQPIVYPRALEEIERVIEVAAQAGAWSITTEGLKISAFATARNRWLMGRVQKGIRKSYKSKVGHRDGSDYVLNDDLKKEYIELAMTAAHAHGMKYFSADNSPLGFGDGYECCGTQALRDYNLWTYNIRSRAFGVFAADEKLGQCDAGQILWANTKHITLKDKVDENLQSGLFTAGAEKPPETREEAITDEDKAER